MKILCVAHQRGEVMAAVTSLRGLPPEASVTWASSFKDAARWIRDNEDLAVLLLDAQVGSELCASFLTHLRGVGVTAPAIVVTSDGAADSVEALGFGPTDTALTRSTLVRELPTALLCAVLGEVAPKRHALEKRLEEAALALEAAEQRHAAETATAAVRLADRQARHHVELARIAADRQTFDQKLTSLEQALRRAEELRASEAVASAAIAQRSAELTASLELARQHRESTALAVERLMRREAELAGALGVAASVRDTLERKLEGADSALARAESSATRERVAAAEQQAGLAQRLARAIDERDVVEARAVSAEAAAERLTHRQHELGAQIAGVLAARDGLNRQLVDSQTALETAQERAAREQQDASEQAARREAELHEQIRREIDERHHVEEALAGSQGARQEAAAHQASVIASLTEQQTRVETERTEAAAARDALQQRLRNAEAIGEQARQDHTTAAAEIDRLLRVETELGARFAEAEIASDGFAGRLADAERARQDADEAATQERLAASGRQTELEARLAHELDQRRAVETRLADLAISHQEAEQQHASEISAAAARFAERHAQDEARLAEVTAAAAARLQHVEEELGARLADAAIAHDELGRQMAETKSTLGAAHEHAARERQAATEQATRHETERQELRAQLDEITAAHEALDQQLVHTKTDLEAVQERTARERQEATAQHGSAMTSLTVQFAEQRTRFEAELTEAAGAREGLQLQLQDAEAIGERAREDLAIASAEIGRLLTLETELSARLAEATTDRDELARRLADAERARQDADEAATRDRLVATERQTGTEARLAEELDQRRTVEERLAGEVAARRDAEAQHVAETATVVTQFAERCARLETEVTEIAAAREALGRQSTEQQHTLAHVQQELRATATSLEGLTQREGELNALVAEQVSGLTRLEALVAERDRQLADRAAQFSASEQALGQLQHNLQSAVSAHTREVGRLEAQLRAASGELESTRNQRDTWHAEADQVPQLQKHLAEIRAEMQRQFDQHPLPMCQCTSEGVLTRANRAFASLVGCRAANDRHVLEVATTLFTGSNDLSRLIERGRTQDAADAIEATWRNVHGGRLVVRLSAMAAHNQILIVAQDITPHHLLQDTLNRARRMEAVGRLASEVAVTCAKLLGDVSRDGELWLATLDGSATHLNRGRLLLGDVARAASFLRQLDAYGEEQVVALEPVDLDRALRDLEPVLKEVAGDDIELVLPKRPSRRAPAFYVDLKVERVERLLVNVASYARERMRLGGSMIFDLAPAHVDREFVDRYPSVRPGPHVLLTITEARAARSIGPVGLRQELVEANEAASPSERPGVDLGALHNLVRASGGHLWMEADPPGDMVIKIHLPLRERESRSWSAASLARAAMRVSGARR